MIPDSETQEHRPSHPSCTKLAGTGLGSLQQEPQPLLEKRWEADTHLRDAADDVRVLPSIVFLIPAEDLHLPAFQSMDLTVEGGKGS